MQYLTGMSQNTRLLIVIADGAHVRFVRPDADGTLHTVTSIDSPAAHKQSSDIGSDHPGAAFHSQSSAHHARQPRHDPQDLAAQDFAHFVAGEINTRFGQNSVDKLLLAAPSHTLGAIRERLDPGAAAAVAGTLGKDLVKTPDHELEPHLRHWLNLLIRYPNHPA